MQVDASRRQRGQDAESADAPGPGRAHAVRHPRKARDMPELDSARGLSPMSCQQVLQPSSKGPAGRLAFEDSNTGGKENGLARVRPVGVRCGAKFPEPANLLQRSMPGSCRSFAIGAAQRPCVCA